MNKIDCCNFEFRETDSQDAIISESKIRTCCMLCNEAMKIQWDTLWTYLLQRLKMHTFQVDKTSNETRWLKDGIEESWSENIF